MMPAPQPEPGKASDLVSIWTVPAGCQGLIFDCDGTLVDSMPLHYQAWTTVLQRHALHLTEARFYEWAGLPIDEIVSRLAREQSIDVDASAVAAERDTCFHSMPASALHPVEAVVDIARRYHGQLPMAVATGSTTASASASLRAIGILEWFDAVISSHDAGRPKPAPDVFLLAAERINLAPSSCVAFEDGDAGLLAAQAAGMGTVDIRPWLPR
ncbi:MAG: HAD-IA family hydrolase [Gemmatimonadetes bacterium]|jgi:HAD superfamily hydrolase (TIGR01509 family)|nr:HAD-IA family hydrolase [Gemmatimonadota bacterium]